MLIKISRERRPGKRSVATVCYCVCDTCNVELLLGKAYAKRKYHFCKICLPKARKKGGKLFEQSRQTSLENWGVEHPLKSRIIRDQIEQTNIEKYGSISYLSTKSCRLALVSSSLERWGVEYPSMSEEIKLKKEQTTLQHYGVLNPSQSEEIKLKKEQTTFQHFGVKNPFQSDEIKKRIQETCIEKYGVKFSIQHPDVYSRNRKSLKLSKVLYHWKTNSPLVCTASYEIAFVNWCNLNQIDFDWQIPHPMPDGRIYIVDAYIKSGEFANIWIEIKGYMSKIGREKWTWFHSQYLNTSQLWDKNKLETLGIL
jgi:hypothetical protein